MTDSSLPYRTSARPPSWWWKGEATALSGAETLEEKLINSGTAYFVVKTHRGVGLTETGTMSGQREPESFPCLGVLPAMALSDLGDAGFMRAYGTSCAYMAGAMANGIASTQLVIALGKAGLLGSFGSGGLSLPTIEQAIVRIKEALPQGPYAINVLHHSGDPAGELKLVDLLLKHEIRVIEASAFLSITPALVYYRLRGLQRTPEGSVVAHHKIIAKVSRQEVAVQLMVPPPQPIVQELLERRLITPEQAGWANQVAMADDITVEADSGGHTDNRSLVSLLPAILALRDTTQANYPHLKPLRIGAAGGISTPAAALAAFSMGAAYIVTGSVNQSCVEASTSAYVKKQLAQAEMADVTMAPCADMFEMGVKVQVLKKGTMFAPNAQKLYELYKTYPSIEAIPADVRNKLEKRTFKNNLDAIWQEVTAYFSQRGSRQLARAQADSKHKMALLFRWYLGNSSKWATTGVTERAMDMQIWCGQAMGAFNAWVKDTYLEPEHNRKVVEVAYHLMAGSLFLYRRHWLQGMHVPVGKLAYIPQPLPDAHSVAAL